MALYLCQVRSHIRGTIYSDQKEKRLFLVLYSRIWFNETIFSDIIDDHLDEAVSQVVGRHPNYGQNMVRGSLAANNINVSRDRVSRSLKRVDPHGKCNFISRMNSGCVSDNRSLHDVFVNGNGIGCTKLIFHTYFVVIKCFLITYIFTTYNDTQR